MFHKRFKHFSLALKKNYKMHPSLRWILCWICDVLSGFYLGERIDYPDSVQCANCFKGLIFWILNKTFQETASLSIVWNLFIHKISSKHDRDITLSKLNFYTHHFCEDVGEFHTIFTFRFSFWTLFDTQLMSFVWKF